MENIDQQWLEALSFSPKSLEYPDSWVGHLPFAAWLISKCKPNIFVELGTHSGNSYFSFCQAVKENKIQTKCYAVDSWKGEEHAGTYGEEIFEKVNAYNQKNYASFSKLMRMQFDEAVNYFSDGSIELLHIDGLHTYEAVKHDFETWTPKLASTSFVIFHDINVRERNFGVWRLWEEIKKKYPLHLEFLHSHGLGVLCTGKNDTEIPWMRPHTEEQRTVQLFFQGLGEKQFFAYNLLRKQEENSTLKSEIQNFHAQVATKDQEIAEQNARLTEFANKEASFRETEQLLLAEIASLQQTCTEVTQSRSWRITKPLRMVAQGLRKGKIRSINNLGQKFFHHIYHSGLRNTCVKTWAFLRDRLHSVHSLSQPEDLQSLDENSHKEDQCDPIHTSSPIKLLAYYLPQFHPIPENDRWWGEGFTEWANVARAQPLYPGHNQPDLPGPLGFYDLRIPEVMRKQVDMAKHHGIYGFCFHYYWFSGKRLLELPLERYLEDPSCDLPFCLNWANENWSRRWDGRDQEVLIQQAHSPEDDLAIMQDLLRYFSDPRYIRVDGRPVFLVYHAKLLPDMEATLERWRKCCEEQGERPPYFVMVQSFENQDPRQYGFDAATQFPPHIGHNPLGFKTTSIPGIIPGFTGRAVAYEELRDQTLAGLGQPFTLFPCVCPNWDNTPRRGKSAYLYPGATPKKYAQWLTQACAHATKTLPDDRAFVFVNAWNEWAEGAHLEPNQHYGYAFLNATSRVLAATGAAGRSVIDPKLRLRLLVVSHDAARAGAQILLLEHLRWLKRHAAVDIHLIILQDGALRADFEATCPVLLCPPQRLSVDALKKFCGMPDLIFGNTAVAAAAYDTLSTLGVPIITHVHELEQSLQKFAGQATLDKMLRYTNRYVAASESIRQNLISRHGVTPDAIQTIRAFITPTPIHESPNRSYLHHLGIRQDSLIVLGCGSRDWRKGVDIFVEVARRVLETPNCPSVTFIWIGGGSDPSISDPQELAENYGLSKQVLLLGEQADPQPYFQAADIFLLTSREDPFPLVCLEAAASKTPVICFDETGDMPEFVGLGGGFVTPKEDVEAMATQVFRLLGSSELRNKLGQKAFENLHARHTTDIAVPKLLTLCREVAGKPAPVSVIVPNYNYANYLDQRLASVFEQTFRDMEVIVLDDASTDQSLEVLTKWQKRTNLQLIKNISNSGNVFVQWRKGLELAKGEFIWIAEADDDAAPSFLATLLTACAQPGVVMAYSIPQVIDGQGHLASGFDYRESYLTYAARNRWTQSYEVSGREEAQEVLSVVNCVPNVSAVVLRKPDPAILEDCEAYRCSGDWLFYLHLAAYGRIAYVHGNLAFHRRHDQSVIGEDQQTKQCLLRQEMEQIHQFAQKSFGPLPEETLERMKAFRESLR